MESGDCVCQSLFVCCVNHLYIKKIKKKKKIKRQSERYIIYTAQKIKFSIKDFFSKCDQIRRKLRILSHLLKKSLMENFIFCAVFMSQDELLSLSIHVEFLLNLIPVLKTKMVWFRDKNLLVKMFHEFKLYVFIRYPISFKVATLDKSAL